MISIKTHEEIEKMHHAGKILAEVLMRVVSKVQSGVTELEIDQMAERMIRDKGAEPGFQKVKGYHHTICAATNEVVVHGIPSQYVFQKGDIVGIDCGVFYEGFHTDMAETVLIPDATDPDFAKKKEFLEVGKRALHEAIDVAQSGNRVGHISQKIQQIVEGSGYSVVRSLVGHGVGRKLHEEPEVPGYLNGKIEKTPILKSGMTIAVEIIYTMGKPDVVYRGNDNWTIQTKDGSLSGVFERTILITNGSPVILTV